MLTNSPQVVSETAQNVFEQFLTENVTGIKVLPKQDNKVSPNYYVWPFEFDCFRNCTNCLKWTTLKQNETGKKRWKFSLKLAKQFESKLINWLFKQRMLILRTLDGRKNSPNDISPTSFGVFKRSRRSTFTARQFPYQSTWPKPIKVHLHDRFQSPILRFFANFIFCWNRSAMWRARFWNRMCKYTLSINL